MYRLSSCVQGVAIHVCEIYANLAAAQLQNQICNLCIGPERCVACKSFGLDMQVSLLKLVLLGLGEVSLQVEHGGVERSCYFFM